MVFEDKSILAAAVLGTLSMVGFQYYKIVQEQNETNENLSYFKSTKNLAMKDILFVKLLEENETRTDGKACWVITDPGLEDNPIIYSSDGFCALTKYSKEEIEGKNCRFLQGANTDPKDVQIIRDAVEKGESCSACLLNYKKDGTTFVNQFFLCPLFDEDDKIAYYVGVQAEANVIKANQEGENIGWRIFKWL